MSGAVNRIGGKDADESRWDRALGWRCAACWLLATACIVFRFCWTIGV